MGISTEEWKELTESRYWRPEVGKQYHVILAGWHFERRAFKEQEGAVTRESEQRATLVCSVLNVNGEAQQPPKEFSSSNKALNRMLQAAVLHAESAGRAYIKLAISRSDAKTYSVVDLAVVDRALARPVTPAVAMPAY